MISGIQAMYFTCILDHIGSMSHKALDAVELLCEQHRHTITRVLPVGLSFVAFVLLLIGICVQNRTLNDLYHEAPELQHGEDLEWRELRKKLEAFPPASQNNQKGSETEKQGDVAHRISMWDLLLLSRSPRGRSQNTKLKSENEAKMTHNSSKKMNSSK